MTSGHAGLFLDFFYRLRTCGLKVTPTQWITLIEGLSKGLHGSSMIGFYSLARAILVKDETELDDFDQVFAAHFKGAKLNIKSIEEDVLRWLENPIAPYQIDPALQKVLDEVDIDGLREEFENRLAQQTEKHDGGNRWVGTGGTSPFGHSGYHPGGIRVGGEGRLGSAVQVAAERRYRSHRKDLILDTRQFGVALKKLRALKREGIADELDIEQTIAHTAKQGGELDLVFQAPRENKMSLVLAMDVGGSMEPYRHLVDLLFSAAHGANHFKRFEHVYFHNCIYEHVYTDSFFTEVMPLNNLIRRFDKETRLVVVGDAYMYPGELTQRFGAVQWYDRNDEPGIAYLSRLKDHFRHTAWLNPMTENRWYSPSVQMIKHLFKMYPLTVNGVENLATDLSRL